MAGANIVTTTQNRIVFVTDHSSYQRALKQIKSIGAAWQKASNKIKPVKMDAGLSRATALSRQQLADQKKKKQLLDRELRATNALRKVSFDIARLQGQSITERQKNIEAAKAITREYREGKIELAQMNEQMRQLKTKAVAAARINRNLAKSRGQKQHHDRSPGSMFGVAGAVSAGAAAAAGVGYATYRNLDTASTRAHNLLEIQRQTGVDPNVLTAMVQWGEQHGVDSASVDKLADNLKDLDERTGEFSLNAKRNKAGEWTGGGQWTEAANALKLSMDDIKQLQGKPLEAAALIVERGQQMKLSESQINHLLENMADDLLYYRKLFENNGAELIKTIQQRHSAGLTFTGDDMQALENMYQFNIALKQGSESLQNKFVVGLAQSITGTDDLKEAFAILRPQVQQLGESMGTLIRGLTTLIGWLPTTKVNEAQQNLKNNSLEIDKKPIISDKTWHDWIPVPLQELFNIGPNANRTPAPVGTPPQPAISNPVVDWVSNIRKPEVGFGGLEISPAAMFKPPTVNIPTSFAPYANYQNQNQNKSEQRVTIKTDVNVTTNGKFQDAIDTSVNSAISDYDRNQINMIMGGAN